jgi:hypothetical protein
MYKSKSKVEVKVSVRIQVQVKGELMSEFEFRSEIEGRVIVHVQV